ncbi:MAG: ribonuclease J [Oscillospiraceae bacterium]|nr:ribonuclease J [Clostridiales bacterium]MDD6107270.1 ribonuclease J [Clostridiales bacterium]MDD6936082.1 ribonuclease J [Clostridiales bacterium]MDY2962060.1 ribonuclease J [Oscillospiraceae bacterium]
MASKLKIIPLGGLGEIGKNLTVYEYGKDIILVDCGMGFPDQSLYGVDMVIPDITYLKSNRDHIRGMIITHGHEDHIGAIPYVLRELDIPIYTAPLTAAIIELKLEEHDLLYHTQIFTKKPGDRFKLGCFEVEFIHVNHSIADAVALAIKTPIGTVIQTGDFKIDITPIQGGMIDLPRLGQLGNEGVLALLSDSTNVERPGYSASESRVGDCFDELFKNCDKRIIVTTFASNVHRLQQIINVAAKYKRKVGITGRSMENVMRVATELDYVDIPEGVMVDMAHIGSLPKNKTVVICTGSQGETMSALYRMAFSEHRQVSINAGDRVIISASAIPGNETTISKVIDELFQKGAEVIYDRNTPLHVSGHACQEELKMMLALTKPQYFIPVHGEYRMLCKHAEIAKMMGVEPKNVVVSENGKVIELTKRSIKSTASVPAGDVYIDGTGVGDVGSAVLRDRRHLAEDGVVMAIVTLSADDGKPVAQPEIITRGFVYVKEAENLIDELKRVVNESLDSCERQRISEWSAIKGRIKSNISGYLYKTTRRSPMVLPVIIEV